MKKRRIQYPKKYPIYTYMLVNGILVKNTVAMQKEDAQFFWKEWRPLMDFSLCGETIKTRVCSLSKKLIPIAVIADGLKNKAKGFEGCGREGGRREKRAGEVKGWAAIIATAFSASRIDESLRFFFFSMILFTPKTRKGFVFSRTST